MKILFYPHYTNPYQHILADSLKENAEIIFYKRQTGNRFIYLFSFYPFIFLNRIYGCTIFHLHWFDFFVSSTNPLIQFLSFINTLTSLFWIKILGYKLVWTVHNVVPHDKVTSNDTLVTKIAGKLSDVLIVHSQDTISRLKNLGIDVSKCVIISMGNYNIYPNTTDRNKSRQKLSIDQHTFVFLYLGIIRKYKNLEELLQVFEKLLKSHNQLLLIIAGKIHDPNQESIIRQYATKHPTHIRGIHDYIPDDEMQYYFHSADVSVFPFKNITTTSSVLLSLAFSTPPISPKLGNIKDLPNTTGFYYDSLDPDGLRKMMEKAIKEKATLQNYKKNIQMYTATISWEESARKTMEVYQKLRV